MAIGNAHGDRAATSDERPRQRILAGVRARLRQVAGPIGRLRVRAEPLRASVRAAIEPRVAPLRPHVDARVAPLRAELAPVLRAELRTRAHALLSPRADALAAAQADADAIRGGVQAAERRAAAALARLDRGPFRPAMTVHAAHARHPGVGGVFARHGLPRCLDCAVGADETLAEAAVGEGLPLDVLLGELNALLAC